MAAPPADAQPPRQPPLSDPFPEGCFGRKLAAKLAKTITLPVKLHIDKAHKALNTPCTFPLNSYKSKSTSGFAHTRVEPIGLKAQAEFATPGCFLTKQNTKKTHQQKPAHVSERPQHWSALHVERNKKNELFLLEKFSGEQE